MGKAIAIAVLLLAVPAFAQIGGNGVTKAPGGGNTLGYNALQPTLGLSSNWYCANSAFSKTGTAVGYLTLYDQFGRPHTVPVC